ncbi:hypothetical protein B0J14DRAFT_562297 [Halenospora varia]|nr:hypothetical protein B0J14DRAFT_562297 [Halenospora varia]
MASTQVFDLEGDLTFVLTRRLSKTERVYAMIVGKGLEACEEAAEALQIARGTLEEELDFEEADLPPSEEQIQMLVSSKHLSLASSVFGAMFKNNFRAGLELQSSGKAEVPLPEDDLEAFTVLMSIIHGRGRQIPRKVPLSLLLKLAILVDKYQLLEAVSPWGIYGSPRLNSLYLVDFATTLFPGSVSPGCFGAPTNFKLSPCPSKGKAPNPISQHLMAKKHLKHFRYQPWVVYCAKGDTQCEGMILGTLLRSASQLEIWPIPDSPYHNMSYSLVAHKMRSLTATSYCFKSTRFKKDANPVDVDRAGILDNVERLLLNVESLQFGLSLEDYPREGDRGEGGQSL